MQSRINKKKLKKRIIRALGRHETLNVAVFLMLFAVLAVMKPEIVGFVVYQDNNYIETVSIGLNSSANYSWFPEINGSVTTLKLTGNIIAIAPNEQSSVSIRLNKENTSYLIYENQNFSLNESESIDFFDVCTETCEINITDPPHTISVETKNTIVSIENITYRITLTEDEINETLPSINETEPLPTEENNTVNETVLLSDVTTQGNAVLGEPVEWLRNIVYAGNATNITITFPADVTIIDVFSSGENITANVPVIYGNNTSMFVESFENLSIVYSTPAVDEEETQISENVKQIKLTTSRSYENVFAFADIGETFNEMNFFVYADNERIQYNAVYNDTNSDGLVDRIEWRASNFTSLTFEIEKILEAPQIIIQDETSNYRDGEVPTETEYHASYDIEKYVGNKRRAIVYSSSVNALNEKGTYQPFNDVVNLSIVNNKFFFSSYLGNFTFEIFFRLSTGHDVSVTGLPGGTKTTLTKIKTGKSWEFGANFTNISRTFADAIQYVEFRIDTEMPSSTATKIVSEYEGTYDYTYKNIVVNNEIEIDNFDLLQNKINFSVINATTLRINNLTGMSEIFIDPVVSLYSEAGADGEISFLLDNTTTVAADATSTTSRMGTSNTSSRIYRSYFSFNTSFVESSWAINSLELYVYSQSHTASCGASSDSLLVDSINASDRIGNTLETADATFPGPVIDTVDWSAETGWFTSAPPTTVINANNMTDFELRPEWIPSVCSNDYFTIRQTEFSGTAYDPYIVIDYYIPCSGNDRPAFGNDWVVDQATICENVTIDMKGSINITVANPGGMGETFGSLTLRNVTLNFNTTGTVYNINATKPSGASAGNIELNIINSTLTTNSTVSGFLIQINNNTNFYIRNSTIKGPPQADRNTILLKNTEGKINITNNRFMSNNEILMYQNNTKEILVLNNSFSNTLYTIPIDSSDSSGIRIENNTINGTSYGEALTGVISIIRSKNISIIGNKIENSLVDVIILYGIYADSSQNITIKNNLINNTETTGIYLSSVNLVSVLNNTVIYTEDSDGIKLIGENSTIENNTISLSSGYGIYLENGKNISVYGNVLNSNTDGIIISSSLQNTIKRNSISNSTRGIVLYLGSSNNTFQDDLIENISSSGFYIETSGENTTNVILANTTYVNISNSCSGNVKCIMNVSWYLDVNVNDTNGALSGANVTTANTTGYAFSSLTDAGGKTRHNLTEFVFDNGTRYYRTPYTINATYPEHRTYSSSLNITQSTELFITIKDVPVVTLDVPKNNSADADGSVAFYINITDVSGIKNITFYDNFTGTYDANVTFFPFNKNYLSPNAGFDVQNFTFITSAASANVPLDSEADWTISNQFFATLVNETIGGSGKIAANMTKTTNTTTTGNVLRRLLTLDHSSAGNSTFALEPNTQYYFSGWMKTLMRSGGANFTFLSGGGSNCSTTSLTYKNAWTFVMCNITTGTTISAPEIRLRSVNANGIIGSVLVDNLSITKINQSLPSDYEDRPIYLSIEEDGNCTITDECSFVDGAIVYNYGISCGANCFDHSSSGAEEYFDNDVLLCDAGETCNTSFTLVNISSDGIYQLWTNTLDNIGNSLSWSTDNATYVSQENFSAQYMYHVLDITVRNGNSTLFVKKSDSSQLAFFDRFRLVPMNPKPGNITAMRANFNKTGIANGRYVWNAKAFDVLGKSAFADANYTLIIGTASVAIAASGNFSTIRWNITTLISDQIDLPAESNNGTGPSNYYVNISSAGTEADVYIKTTGNLTSGSSVITINNEKFAYNTTNPNVPSASNQSLSSNFTLVSENLGDNTLVYFKFYLNVTPGTSAGVYNNTVSIKIVPAGEAP